MSAAGRMEHGQPRRSRHGRARGRGRAERCDESGWTYAAPDDDGLPQGRGRANRARGEAKGSAGKESRMSKSADFRDKLAFLAHREEYVPKHEPSIKDDWKTNRYGTRAKAYRIADAFLAALAEQTERVAKLRVGRDRKK